MKLSELTTPYERRRVIQYGKDRNTVVRHGHEVQRITGNLYKSRETVNEWKEQEYNVFLFFPGVHDGLQVENRMKHPDWRTVDQYEQAAERYGFDSPESYLLTLDERTKSGGWIGNAIITFVRQFDAIRAEQYAAYRMAYIAKRDEEEHKRREEAARREAEKAEEKRRIDAEARALYHGWTDDMTPMRFGRIDAFMSARVRVDGVLMTKREFIEKSLADGWRPEMKEGVTSYYGSRWNVKQSKPRTEYRLCRDNLMYEIAKTEYDYAVFLSAKAAEVA